MRFSVSSSTLSSRLQAISRVINPKSINPILQDFLFRTEGTSLTVTAADNDTTLETTIELAENENDAQIALPAKTMLDALKEIPDQPITFQIDENTHETVVSYLNGQYNVMGHDADEYPQPSVMAADTVSHVIPASVFSSGISRCIFAVADDELRPVMNGVFIDFDTEHIAFVASDGHKLVCDKNSSYKSSERSSVILPKRPASLLKSIMGTNGDITVCFDNRIATITMADYRLTCRLIEGRYPNYNSVIPANNPHRLTIDRQAFISALKRVSVFSPASSGLIRLRIKDSQLAISTQDLDFSTSANETLTCQYDGAPMSIGFKAGFLIDILGNTMGQEVIFKLADPSRAGVVVPSEQEENDDLLMLLMPMVLND
ncbi:MAG: DNA polymerase III subunit beta [Bacteroidaceae bacterium]|nr:DNA polymerase III subunit beta [Bacteroidaceae bacterium]